MLKRFTYIVVLVCNVLFFAGALALGVSIGTSPASAACSPGIPCTDYDLYNDPSAGVQTVFNGLKSGEKTIPANLVEDGPCDGNLMNQMYSKAFMEASRQIIMSEQIIHKPDSVLEYTCFEGYIADAAKIESEFSYTTHWKDNYKQDRETADETITDTFDVYRDDFNNGDTNCGATDMGDGDACGNNLAEAMNYIVNESLDSYLDANFDHTYLGEATTIDPSGTPAGCADMATVWEIAKCLDFGEDDRFRTFADLINADPRSIPQECSGGNSFADDVEDGTDSTKLNNSNPDRINNSIPDQCPPSGTPVAGVNTDFSNDLIRVSNNCPSENVAGEHAYVMIDPVEFQDFLIMGAGINSGLYIPGTGGEKGALVAGVASAPDGIVTCAAPLPTGIPVITYEHDAAITGAIPQFFEVPLRRKYVHYEYMCPNPGCFYRPPKQLLNETEVIPNLDDFVTNNGIGNCVKY